MRLAFYLIAAAMIVAALLLVLLPLVRHGRRLGRPRGVFALAMIVAFCLPLAAIGLYLAVGTPVVLDGVPKADAGMSIDQAVDELNAHLVQKPDDLQGWMLLGQTYSVMHRAADARHAYDEALRIDPNNGVAMVGWAEADSLLREDHRIEGRAQELLERAVKIDPQSQRGLWLLGISQFQHDKFAEAATTWRQLQPQLDPDSNVAKAVATDADFHAQFVDFLGNREISRVTDQLRDRMQRVIARVFYLSPSRIEASCDEHGAIAGAVLDGDGDKAADLITRHLERGKRLILSPRGG